MQIVGILCRTPDKDARLEVLRRCAGGGGTFDQVGGGKIELPAVNLNDVGDQADDIIAVYLNVYSFFLFLFLPRYPRNGEILVCRLDFAATF